jgi:hypothetical protein
MKITWNLLNQLDFLSLSLLDEPILGVGIHLEATNVDKDAPPL